ncbi:type VII secretion protein EccB [Streptomyces sp. NPDC054775]
MQTRRDHLHAYRFATGRLATALVTGDPGRGDSPTRRGSLGTFFGVLLVVLLCAGFAVYGLISPDPKPTWRQPGSIIVEKETGNRYLLIAGVLRPVVNYSSALLLAGPSASTRTVDADSLRGVPHGAPVGIQGAPDSLPAPSDILSGGWARCLRPDMPGGEVLDFSAGRAVPLQQTSQIVLADSEGNRFLLWQARLYPIPSEATLIALGLDGGATIPAPDTWLRQLTKGPTLQAPAIPGSAAASRIIAGHRVHVGTVLRTSTSPEARNYVVLSDGIAAVSPTSAALLKAGAPSVTPIVVDSAVLASVPVSRHIAPGANLPDVVNAPALQTGSSAVCLLQSLSGKNLSERIVLKSGQAATGTHKTIVPAGKGLLVVNRDQELAGVSAPQTYLVTDQGTLFPLGDSQAASVLRLSGPGTSIPSEVLKLLAQGPPLSSKAAVATLGKV